MLNKLLILILTTSFVSTRAQENGILHKGGFSNIILSRLNDVSLKIQVSLEEQRLLAIAFRTQDSILQAEVQRGDVYKGLRSFTLTQDSLKLISTRFAAKEFENISIPVSNFNYALLFRGPLCLKRKQIDQLIKSNKESYEVKKGAESEFEALRRILTLSQYKKYFEISSGADALKWTQLEWNKLLKSFSAKELDSVNVNKIIYKHQLSKLSGINYFSSIGEKDSVGAIRGDKLFGIRMFRQALDRKNYSKYFQMQNEKSIQMAVERNWKTLASHNLVTKSDSVKFFDKDRTYELNLRLAIEDYAFDNSLSKKHTIQYWLGNKPEVLKLLDNMLLENSMGLKDKY